MRGRASATIQIQIEGKLQVLVAEILESKRQICERALSLRRRAIAAAEPIFAAHQP